MQCRKSVAAMIAAGEAGAYVNAVLRLKDPVLEPSIISQAQLDGAESRYDDYVWMHKAAFSLIHLGPAFGPWHREILRQFELDLRHTADEGGFANPDSIYVPYWDWPNGNSPGDGGWPFVDSLMGGLGTGTDGGGNPTFAVETGPFAGAGGKWPINVTDVGDPHTVLDRVSATNPNSGSIPNQAAIRSALVAEPYDSVPYNANAFPSTAQAAASFRKSLEFFLHNGPHNWVGNMNPGPPPWDPDLLLDMMAASSPNDPIFFLHHAAIDRIWQIWQERQAKVNNLAPDETFEPTSGANLGHDLTDVMDIMDQSYFKWTVRDTNASNLDLHATSAPPLICGQAFAWATG